MIQLFCINILGFFRLLIFFCIDITVFTDIIPQVRRAETLRDRQTDRQTERERERERERGREREGERERERGEREREREMDQAGTDICSRLLFHLALRPPSIHRTSCRGIKTEESGGVETLILCVSGP